MLGILKNWLDDNAREIKKLSKQVQVINSLEPEIQALSDEALRGKTAEFKQRLANGASLDDLLPEAFAVVREAARRVLGMRPFDVQVMGGIVLHQGRIAEMKTGEGKTLVATMPAYLNALTGQGVHIVTVNDYLARRDREWMGKIYEFLGLSVGVIVQGLDFAERKKAYAADITYGTNNEFGFDYLRDNMALHVDQLVQRELNYAIIDEVDSILIDEARTPLIISGQADKPTDLYYTIARVVSRLKKDEDYTVDEKAHVVTLTEQGIAKVEKMLGVENLYDPQNMELSHHVNQALKAHALMKKDRDYIVKDGKVIIVDEFTGRLMFGRRYSDGLHQAIEAKEGVKIERESQTLATITFQNFFRMYKKLAGMTGTAATEEEEFRKIYNMDVVVIPTNKPMIRVDYPDVVYRTEKGKFEAVVKEIVERHRKGQPVLVGTVSIEKSEELSRMLKKHGIPHQVLNAKYHEQEAEIIARAGQKGAVTIATNMAGRGTDIVLGEGVKELGGLHIIGTERHESRRIDNQLRGRAGRQGDPGSSRFYISLEDDLMRLFGSDNIAGLMDKLGMDDSTPIDHPLISRSIEAAQKKVEARNFEIRKHVLEYDDVLNQQRDIIYKQRREVLFGKDLKEKIQQMIRDVIDRTIERFSVESDYPEQWDLSSLLEYAEQQFLPGHDLTPEQLKNMDKEEIRRLFHEKALEYYEAREKELGEATMRELERVVTLKVVDSKWMDHLDAMDQLRQGIGLRAYGQRDPLVEYKFEAYQMFNDMIASIQEDIVRYVFRVNVVEQPREQYKNVVENKYAEEESRQPIRRQQKIGRNEPCPCGSGKKYKKCCGRN
ncbi:preprotein translocase subunit SecA [Calderihabitans maritimus]|uniref:Protein translocase subunit SecA n=1 Tax=Calderihabitans maritimus TaxID=1246530 RepID=A0A1Z5HV43_9FIRM|nr:preprotein translocase subunit SecA [Calderihabitans maritimus]GAW93160.1 protein translocase subunit secA [Calderihabitans maritimus]